VINLAIIHQFDKRSGITYAYESIAQWDKEKKMSRAKRTLIGRVDPETGEIIPTDGRRRKNMEKQVESAQTEDYKDLYEKLEQKCKAQELLIAALKNEVQKLKEHQ
jgi:hypothetical protein